MNDLTGKNVLITGAGAGIGRVAAIAFAQAGANVVLVGRTRERLSAVQAEIGAAASVLDLDLREPNSCAQIRDDVDVLIHGAAAFAPYAGVERTTEDDIQAVVDTSLGAGIRLAGRVLPGMKQRGFGRLLFLGSAAARDGAPGQAAYAAAKAGLGGLVRSLAMEGGAQGVTANLLELGLIDTERTLEKITGDARSRLERGSALGRAGRPEEVAQVLTFLASNQASFITGTTLVVDGGLGLGVVPPRGDMPC